MEQCEFLIALTTAFLILYTAGLFYIATQEHLLRLKKIEEIGQRVAFHKKLMEARIKESYAKMDGMLEIKKGE